MMDRETRDASACRNPSTALRAVPLPLTGEALERDGARMEYTMTAKIDLTLVGVTEAAELEEKIREYWAGYLKAVCDEIDMTIPMDNITLSEIKIFAREA